MLIGATSTFTVGVQAPSGAASAGNSKAATRAVLLEAFMA
jgi:hypothetical protein